MQRVFGDDKKDYLTLTDEQLAERCKSDENLIHTLVIRYASVVRARAVSFSVAAVDTDDLMQEGFLGLISAIRTFNPDKEIRFSTYANRCIVNRMKSALVKNKVFDIPSDDERQDEPDPHTPESIFFEKESSSELEAVLSTHLSERERKIFRLFLQGATYEQMAKRLRITPKAVDNALQRVRKKLKNVWRAENFST